MLADLSQLHKKMQRKLKEFRENCKKEPLENWNSKTHDEMSNFQLYETFLTVSDSCYDVIVSLEAGAEDFDEEELVEWVGGLRRGLEKREFVGLNMEHVLDVCKLQGISLKNVAENKNSK